MAQVENKIPHDPIVKDALSILGLDYVLLHMEYEESQDLLYIIKSGRGLGDDFDRYVARLNCKYGRKK